MILLCKPKGRGNWTPTTFAVEGGHLLPMLVRIGACFTLGGITWRICKIIT